MFYWGFAVGVWTCLGVLCFVLDSTKRLNKKPETTVTRIEFKHVDEQGGVR